MSDQNLAEEVYVDVRSRERQDTLISRVTYRVSLVRERSGEEYQVFPSTGYAGAEIPIDNDQPAYTVPGMKLSGVVKVQFGWIEAPRVFAVINRTHWRGSYVPTPEEQSVIDNSLIGVGFDGTTFPLLVAPGQLQPLLLNHQTQVFLKAISGEPTYSIFCV